MDGDDWREYNREKRARRQAASAARLEAADPTGWSRHTLYHWYRDVNGERIDYWPSTETYQFRKKVFKGSCPNHVRVLIEKDNAKC